MRRRNLGVRQNVLAATCFGVAVAIFGCADKAKPSFDECLKAEANGDLARAASLCEASVNADPGSPSGRAAAEKVIAIRKVQADAERAAKAKADAEREAKREAECTEWKTTCTLADGVTPGGSETFKTKADCVALTRSTFDGVQLFHCDRCRCVSP